LTLQDNEAVRLRRYIDQASGEGVRRLPSEPKLSELLSISRGRLRTLLRKLEAEGLIWRHVGKGTFLGARDPADVPRDWDHGLSIADIMEARMSLEPQLAAQAAIHATGANIAALERCIEEMQAKPAFDQWKQLDDRLHRLIAEATHNGLLLRLYDTLRTHGRLVLDARLKTALEQTEPLEPVDRQHLELVQALAAHDPMRAEAAMRAHLREVRSRLFGER
jgi:GntR family transcriptional repressor for pyruvate dehydrogenase complex